MKNYGSSLSVLLFCPFLSRLYAKISELHPFVMSQNDTKHLILVLLDTAGQQKQPIWQETGARCAARTTAPMFYLLA